MRNEFDRQLVDLRDELVSLFSEVVIQLHEAVDALKSADRDKAKEVKRKTRELDLRCEQLEDSAYRVVSLQQPVASDLRFIQFIVYAVFIVGRMNANVRGVSKAAKRSAKVQVPKELVDVVMEMAQKVYCVLDTTIEATMTSDVVLATTLPSLDYPVDMLNKHFFRVLAELSTGDALEAAARVVDLARLLEHTSDDSVELGSRLVYMLTGQRVQLEALSGKDGDELSCLYVPRAMRSSARNVYDLAKAAENKQSTSQNSASQMPASHKDATHASHTAEERGRIDG